MQSNRLKKGFRILLGFVLLLSIVILFKLVDVHFFESDVSAMKKNINPKKVKILGKRGNICTSDDRYLAISTTFYELRMDFKADGLTKERFYNNLDTLSQCLANYFKNKTKIKYKTDLETSYKKGNRYYRLYPNPITYLQLEEIKKFPLLKESKNKSGFIAKKIEKRTYPLNFKMGRTVGRLSKAIFNEDDRPVGIYGLEASYESILKGEEGLYLRSRIPGGYINKEVRKPEDGEDLITTIDVQIQDITEKALSKQILKSKAKWATAIVMDVHTGDIKALSNLKLDPHGNVIEGDENYALGNAGCMEPGSTFKLPTMITILESGKADTSTIIDTGNGVWKVKDRKVKDSDWRKGGHGKITLKQVFELSSNVGTAKITEEIYGKNPKEYVDRLYKLRLNEPLEMDIKGLAMPSIRYPTAKNWWGTTLAWMSFGYGVTQSPLHTLTLYSAVANNGKMMEPRIVKAIRNKDGKLERFRPQIRINSICSNETLEQLQAMLVGAIDEGTGKRIKNDKYKIGGKTGTAQISHGKDGYRGHMGSFVGYFPADNPKYACIAVIYNPTIGGYYGTTVGAPVFKEISDMIFSYDLNMNNANNQANKEDNDSLNLPPISRGYIGDYEEIFDEYDIPFETNSDDQWGVNISTSEGIRFRNEKMEENTMPNLKGMGLADVLYLMENKGYHVIAKGVGKVARQSIAPGTKLYPYSNIYIELR